MEYTIKECLRNNGTPYLNIIFNDDSFAPLQTFIMDDFSAFSKEYLEIFDKVLSDKSEKESVYGNACSFEVTKDKTIIEFLYPEDEDNPEICSVSTQELRVLMDDWLHKRNEFQHSR